MNATEQKITLADKYKGKFTSDVKGITNLTTTLKRTKTSMTAIFADLSNAGQLNQKEKEVLSDAIDLLRILGNSAARAKTDVKRQADYLRKTRDRLESEAIIAVENAFCLEQVSDVVVLLAWRNEIKRDARWRSYWRQTLKEGLSQENKWQEKKFPIMAELRSMGSELIRDIVKAVALTAEVNDESVQVIVERILSDFEVNKISLLESEKDFIQEIKVAAVEQKLKESNAIKQG